VRLDEAPEGQKRAEKRGKKGEKQGKKGESPRRYF
tara:strand:+ start:308 stop:412 length:105 start_codon:yes stop_codon:yes gene_type:complete